MNSCGDCGNAYQEPGASLAGTTKSRAPSGVDRGFNFDEALVNQRVACSLVHVGPHLQRAGRGWAAKVQVAVPQPDIFASLGFVPMA